jgi:ribosomal protein L37AE/L43A
LKQPIHPDSTKAETCPAFEPRKDPLPENVTPSKSDIVTEPPIKTGTILDKLPSAIDDPKPKAIAVQKSLEQAKTDIKPAGDNTLQWRKTLAKTALDLYDYGFNVIPTNEQKSPISSTWSSVQRISREELEEKIKKATGIAVIGGDVNPWSENYKLVLIDVDAPRSVLEKSPKLRELVETSVSWKTGIRCPKCEGKHFDVLENGLFKCKKCGHEFSLNEAKERGLGIMVLVEKQVAEKYGLKRTLRKGEIEFLVENYQLIPPSKHKHGIQYEWINPIALDKPFAGIVILGEKEVSQLLKELIVTEEKSPQQEVTSQGKNGELRELEDAKILQAKETLKTVYVPGFRQTLWLYFSGWGAKAGISPISIARILKMLYEETQDTDSLKTRAGALVYTYGKAGINLEPYKEDLKALFGEEPYGLLKQYSPENVKGYTGLQEIFESVFKSKGMSEKDAEENAISLINALSEVLGKPSPFRDSLTIQIDYDRQIYAVANLNKLVCVRARRSKEGGLRYMEKVIMGAPTKITVYHSPLKGENTKFKVVWEAKTRPRPIEIDPVEKEDLLAFLEREGLVLHTRLAKDILSAILEGAIEKGFAEIKIEVDKPGFFLIDGKIVAVKVDTDMPDPEELRKALEFFLLVAKYFEHIIDRFSFTVRWGLIAPFSYIYKQKGRMLRGLYAHGQSGAGKTTQGRIYLSMWGLEDLERRVMGATNIDTPAKMGKVVSSSTFPIVANEPRGLFEKTEMVEMVKNVIESLTARARHEHGIFREIPALSNIHFTSNSFLPKDDAMLRRFYVEEYTPRDIVSEDKVKEFEKNIMPRIRTFELAPIGRYVASYILEHGLEEEEPIDYITKILAEGFKYAGLKAPDWLFGDYKEFEASLTTFMTDTLESLRNFFITRINEEFNRFIGKVVVETETGYKTKERRDVELEEKVKVVLENDLIPWMHLVDSGKLGNVVVITSGILEEINGKIPNISNLKTIAEYLKCEYTRVKIAGNTIRVVAIPWENFLNFLNPTLLFE